MLRYHDHRQGHPDKGIPLTFNLVQKTGAGQYDYIIESVKHKIRFRKNFAGQLSRTKISTSFAANP